MQVWRRGAKATTGRHTNQRGSGRVLLQGGCSGRMDWKWLLQDRILQAGEQSLTPGQPRSKDASLQGVRTPGQSHSRVASLYSSIYRKMGGRRRRTRRRGGVQGWLGQGWYMMMCSRTASIEGGGGGEVLSKRGLWHTITMSTCSHGAY